MQQLACCILRPSQVAQQDGIVAEHKATARRRPLDSVQVASHAVVRRLQCSGFRTCGKQHSRVSCSICRWIRVKNDVPCRRAQMW